jgi:site-specific DNA-methyltransferase (adenine-specific)
VENGRWPANVILTDIDETWNRYFYCAKASKADRGPGNKHPTVKPNALMRYLVRLVTPPGGTVFDPFVGSGSTGVAAIQERLSFVGCEQRAEYIKIARRRIAKVIPKNGSVLSDLPLEETPAYRSAS